MSDKYNVFINKILTKYNTSERFPSTSSISRWVTSIMLTLFPEQSKQTLINAADIVNKLDALQSDLKYLFDQMGDRLMVTSEELSTNFFQKLPDIHELLETDIQAIWKGDPAAKSEYEIIRSYPGFYATVFYRIAHELYLLNIPMMPRIITEYAHSKTGIDIHPGATIGTHFCIDHGTGVVIGETCHIGNHVKLYQGITLGALSVSKELAETKRHPTLEDNVVIYSGATILGGDTVIGHNSIIGGNVWLTRSVPPQSIIYHQGEIKVKLPEKETTTEKNISNF